MRVTDPGDAEQAREYALRLLARPRTEHQVREALRRRGYESRVQEEVVVRLRRVGLLDDMAYARAYVQEMLAARPSGRRLLEQKLRQRGISRAVIERVLGDEPEPGPEEEAARRAALAWVRRHGRGEARRLAAYLGRRGFDWELCSQLARELAAERSDGSQDDAGLTPSP